MTRFARGKGSKASNERVPEEATSWQEMKQQMQQNPDGDKQKEFDRKKAKAHLDFIKQDKAKKMQQSTWAEFENTKQPHSENQKKRKVADEKPVVSKNNKKQLAVGEQVVKKIRKQKFANEENVAKKMKKNDNETVSSKKLKVTGDFPARVVSKNGDVKDTIIKKKNKNVNTDKAATLKESNVQTNSAQPIDPKVLNKIQKKKEKRLRQIEKRNKFKAEEPDNTKQSTVNKSTDSGKELGKNENNTSQKPFNKGFKKPLSLNKSKPQAKKVKDSREKIIRPDSQITLDGNVVEIAYFQGFPIRKEDETRLIQLRKDMTAKGIPRSEMEMALKLERRRAEKALAREKKKVCFNCRGSGHTISECPNLKDQNQTGTGICFKCGSTEHTHFECKVVRSQEFKFAQCFICKEQGHIARQCPDNAKGLYPQGGACRVCGDVTHLKKDCPQYQAEREGKQLTLDTINVGNIEGVGGREKNVGYIPKESNRQNKIVKF